MKPNLDAIIQGARVRSGTPQPSKPQTGTRYRDRFDTRRPVPARAGR